MRNPVFTTAFKQYRAHQLVGKLKSHRELHIGPDWLLMYEIAEPDCIFSRTGTHADLFE